MRQKLRGCSANSLHKKYEGYFCVGTAVDSERWPKYEDIIRKHFNSISPENDMKFVNIHPSEDTLSFERMDKLIAYSKSNGCRVHGHTLIWHEQLPDWVKKYDGNEKGLKKVLEDHIHAVVDRYKDDIFAWDVVNEVFLDDKGSFRNTIWFETLGEKFLDYAFNAARESTSDGFLFLNDFNGHVPQKREKIISTIKNLKVKGVPIDGIGIQGHYNICYPSVDMIRSEIEEYARMGLQIRVTELDISVFDYFDRRSDLKNPMPDMIKRQENMYYSLFRLYEEYKDYVSSVTFWGVADDHTWLDDYPVEGRKDWPLLFDENLNEKSALVRILEGKR